MRAVDLHHHNTFSFGDGFGTPEQHAARLEVLERTHFAVTDHGNVSAHPQVEKAALKHGLKPIFGIEAYTALDDKERRKFHLTILAQNAQGYRNLMGLVTESYQHFYHWPTVTGDMLARYSDGLIVLSGCADSLLACSLLGGKSIDMADSSRKRAYRVASRFKELLGDRYYLETQAFPELPRARSLNVAYEQMGKKLGIPLVGTQDVHYPNREDNEMQVILHAALRGSGSVAQQEAGWEYGIRLAPAATDSAFWLRLRDTGLSKRATDAALASTWEIAQRCEGVVLPKAERFRYPLEEGQSAQSIIWDWLRQGWRYRVAHGETWLDEHSEECHERVKHEMNSITAKDFIDYFLMTSDIVRFAKNNGIPVGPARGSAAASLVCYLLRITEINPLRYPLMFFERFIALDREDIPDIDLDFDDGRRHLVREYAVEKYGVARVGNISNYTRYRGKNSMDDVGRVFPQVPYAAIETIKATIVERSGGDSRADAALQDTADMFPIAGALFDQYPDLKKAMRLEGNYRGMGIHAAGIVIANTPIADTCALYTRTRKVNGEEVETTVVSVDKKDGEYLGLMKMDFLSLSTMGMIREALEASGLTLDDLYAIPMDDRSTLEAFRRNDVIGIFQYEGRAQRLINRKIKPDDFLELSDINGLSRPGPLFSGTTTDYINIKWGAKKLEKVHPLWDDFTVFTKGQIIYQEQVLQALAVIGGLPVHRVHEIRKIISQKLGEAQFNASSQDFIDGARSLHGIKEPMAKYMWGRLVTSATYSFNIAHCISYAMLAFWCMWLKVHYPVQFYTAQLRSIDKDGWMRLIKDAERHDIRVKGVDPARSGLDWSYRVKKRTINSGLLQMPQIGPATAQKILDYRDGVTQASPGYKMGIEDLIKVNGIGPSTMEKIRSVDAVDPFGLRKVESQMQAVRHEVKMGKIQVPTQTHISNDLLEAAYDKPLIFYGIVKARNYQDYVENQRSRSGQEIEEILRNMRRRDLVTSCVLQCFDEYDEDVYLRFNRYSYPKFKTGLERLVVGRDVVIVRGQKKSNVNVFGINVAVDRMWIVNPE